MERFNSEVVYYKSNIYKKITKIFGACPECELFPSICSYNTNNKPELFGKCSTNTIWKGLMKK